ncbi:hypothetical protein CANINC_001690 [Pichia inconspicua]|uniref:MI domain-containing protein n=1 Tax=Pichia inconspicua TaxID=52247 RepID=A0A4T0X4D1_9ASCO|nr:hypothetical protein CANINC_001690 [[Candida] inconspicua]
MSTNRKKHGINIPGSILDSIRDNEKYEEDERFTKRQKIKGPSVLHRKENRKLQRQNKKMKKIESKFKMSQNFDKRHQMLTTQEGQVSRKIKKLYLEKNVKRKPKDMNKSHKTHLAKPQSNSFQDESNVESDGSEYVSDEPGLDLQDEQDEENTSQLIQKIRQLKQVQMGEYKIEEPNRKIHDGGLVVASKEEKNTSKSNNMEKSSVLPNSDRQNESDTAEKVDYDDVENSIMKKLAALKGNKVSKSTIKIVKEEEIDDDSLSDIDDEFTDQENEDNGFSKEPSEITDNKLREGDSFRKSDSTIKQFSKEEEEEDIMKKLSALKGNKKSSSKIKIVRESDLEDDSLSSDDELLNLDHNVTSSVVTPADNDTDFDDLKYYASKLKVDKGKGMKLRKEGEDDIIGGLFEGLDFMDKYEDLDNTDRDSKTKTQGLMNEFNFDEPGSLKEEEDMAYYAKKLGINPKDKLKREDEDDVIGGLLEGIELSESDQEDNLKQIKQQDLSKNNHDITINEDDQVNSDDFDDEDDLDEDDKALLREMYGIEGDSDSDSDSDLESESDINDGPHIKENPYVAPGAELEGTKEGSKYLPPAFRTKRIEDTQEDSDQMKQILRMIKGPFNKLSEPTLSNVIIELNNVYNDNPRRFVNEAILKVLMQSIFMSTPMLESFLILYAAAIVALYKLQGVEFGAFIVQNLVEQFIKEVESNDRNNIGVLNVIGYIGYIYTLNLVGSELIYDIIKEKLIKNPTELKTDILLKLIKSCGSKLRTDDTSALNDIITLLTKSLKDNETKGIETTTRSRFLVDTITDLRNNRLKNMENNNSLSMINRLKKQLGSINSGRNLDPIKVSLDDIENIEVRGKWWLVGSAWKGIDTTSKTVENDISGFDDELNESNDVNWMELAKQCRMNTDVRRAIFISIMSAEDFMDAFMKLEKLSLKKSQKLEIPNILMHCATMEINYNPYYSFLAKKLSNEHSMRRAFQLNLWDFIKEIDNEESTTTTILLDSSDDERLWKILNMGRFFGFLIGEGALSLNVLRVINFLTVTTDVELFLEIMIINIFDTIAKHSESGKFGVGSNKKLENIHYTGKVMAECIAKCEEQPLLMKGLRYFINDKLRKSNFIKGKKLRSRIYWAVDTMSTMLDEMIKSKE